MPELKYTIKKLLSNLDDKTDQEDIIIIANICSAYIKSKRGKNKYLEELKCQTEEIKRIEEGGELFTTIKRGWITNG